MMYYVYLESEWADMFWYEHGEYERANEENLDATIKKLLAKARRYNKRHAGDPNWIRYDSVQIVRIRNRECVRAIPV